ncbi:MAG: ribonuclease III family protein [Candidatus Heimdallarchaeota archaeon]
MKKSTLPDSLRTKLIQVMRDHSLAKFGDSLTNFAYSLAKTRQYKQPFGERVLDKSLAEAIRNANLRAIMPSSVSAGDLGDGAEALIGHAFLKKIMTIDEMVEIIKVVMQTKTLEEVSYRSNERLLMAEAFEKVLVEIVKRMS